MILFENFFTEEWKIEVRPQSFIFMLKILTKNRFVRESYVLRSSSTELALDWGPLGPEMLCLNGSGDGDGVGRGDGNSLIGDKHLPP